MPRVSPYRGNIAGPRPARLGIRNFKPTLRKAAERLATLHTPEGSALPPNVSAELQLIALWRFVTTG
jgi:hypothetical protein